MKQYNSGQGNTRTNQSRSVTHTRVHLRQGSVEGLQRANLGFNESTEVPIKVQQNRALELKRAEPRLSPALRMDEGFNVKPLYHSCQHNLNSSNNTATMGGKCLG